MSNIIKGKKGVCDEVYERIIGYHFPSLPKARELLSCAEAVQIHGFLWFAGNGSSQGFQTSITELAKIGMCSERMVRDCLKEMEQCKLLQVSAPRGKPKFYKAFQDPKNHPDNRDPLQNVPMTPDDFASPVPPIEDNRYHTSYDVNDPSGTFTDALSLPTDLQFIIDDGMIRKSMSFHSKDKIVQTWLEKGRVDTEDFQRIGEELLEFANSFPIDDESQITQTRHLMDWLPVKGGGIGSPAIPVYGQFQRDVSSQNNSADFSTHDQIDLADKKTPKNAQLGASTPNQYVDDTGKVWSSFEEYWASLPADAPDEDAPRHVWTNDEGEEDPKRTSMSEIERLIVSWMKAHGSKINRLSAQSMNKLKSRLSNSNETLVMVGAELWKSPEVQKRLAGIANRPSTGHKTAFNQNEIVNILMDEYQSWRKTRDAQRANPEITQLELALVEALGFKMDTIPANSLLYLRDNVLPQLFAADCRAQHARPLIEGMKERKLGFIVGEWTARKKSLEYLTPKATFVPAPFENPFEE